MAKGGGSKIGSKMRLTVELGYPHTGWQNAELRLQKGSSPSPLSLLSTWVWIRGQIPPAVPLASEKTSSTAAAPHSPRQCQEPREGNLEALSRVREEKLSGPFQSRES